MKSHAIEILPINLLLHFRSHRWKVAKCSGKDLEIQEIKITITKGSIFVEFSIVGVSNFTKKENLRLRQTSITQKLNNYMNSN